MGWLKRSLVRPCVASPPHRAIMLDPRYRMAGACLEGDMARVVFAPLRQFPC